VGVPRRFQQIYKHHVFLLDALIKMIKKDVETCFKNWLAFNSSLHPYVILLMFTPVDFDWKETQTKVY